MFYVSIYLEPNKELLMCSFLLVLLLKSWLFDGIINLLLLLLLLLLSSKCFIFKFIPLLIHLVLYVSFYIETNKELLVCMFICTCTTTEIEIFRQNNKFIIIIHLSFLNNVLIHLSCAFYFCSFTYFNCLAIYLDFNVSIYC